MKLTELIDGRRAMIHRLATCTALVVCPAITFYLFDLYTHNPFVSMDIKTQVLNIVFYQMTGLLLLAVFRYVRIALMLQSAIFMVFGLANYYVQSFRSAPIRPWDIFSVQTAASVADNYDYSLDGDAIFVLVAFVLLLLVESRFRAKLPLKREKRLLLLLLPLVMISGYTKMVQSDVFVKEFGLYDKFFTPTVVNKRDGNIVAFLMALEYMDVEKPTDYSPEKVEQLLAGNDAENEKLMSEARSGERPNIIVVMDEAFSDLAVLGDFTTNQDYMPFIHGLQQGAENTVTGLLNVSVIGGNTANTEFEFLTGNTMAFLPQGSVAYQQYLQDETPSLASHLKELGYQTVAIHPYGATGWDRSRVYPLLGFDRFLSLQHFGTAEKVRKYVSDSACFDKIIELYEKKEPGEPLFVFNVTMQNHSGYEEAFDNFTPDITTEGIASTSLSNYLSLIKKTDSAFERLVSYFEQQDEDTIIVFFGDHQPTTYVTNPILQKNGIDPNTLTEEQNLLRYKVPYVIWSNFDIEEETVKETSVNYLMADVLRNSGLPLPTHLQLIEEVREEYPIISAMQVKDKEGNYLALEECGDALNGYRSLQYYYLFDYKK